MLGQFSSLFSFLNLLSGNLLDQANKSWIEFNLHHGWGVKTENSKHLHFTFAERNESVGVQKQIAQSSDVFDVLFERKKVKDSNFQTSTQTKKQSQVVIIWCLWFVPLDLIISAKILKMRPKFSSYVGLHILIPASPSVKIVTLTQSKIYCSNIRWLFSRYYEHAVKWFYCSEINGQYRIG